MSDLRSATAPGDPAAYPGSPGEFAARWNERGYEGRAELLAVIVENAGRAHECWALQHVPGAEVQRILRSGRAGIRAMALQEAAASLEVYGFAEAAAVVWALVADERWAEG